MRTLCLLAFHDQLEYGDPLQFRGPSLPTDRVPELNVRIEYHAPYDAEHHRSIHLLGLHSSYRLSLSNL